MPAAVDPTVTPLAVAHWLVLGLFAGTGPGSASRQGDGEQLTRVKKKEE
jgi:hypothetical protein